jgi:cytochrome c oxidase assembly protein subunit 15
MHRFALFLAGVTFALVFTGGLVTSTGSGLAVPDWPLSFGTLLPAMVGGVKFEHSHRLVAGMVALLTLALAVWVWRREPRRALRWTAAAAVAAVLAQALLGGLTVLLRLPPAVSVAHACLAQAFLCLSVTLALCTGPAWKSAAARGPDRAQPPLRSLCALCAGAVYVQLILGAVMRHTGAGLAIPDFPLAFGRLVPPVWTRPILIHFMHRAGALAVTLIALWVVARVEAQHAAEPLLRRPARLLVALVAAQVSLGALTVWSGRAVLPTTLHVAVGAGVLAASVVLALRAWRLLEPAAPALRHPELARGEA